MTPRGRPSQRRNGSARGFTRTDLLLLLALATFTGALAAAFLVRSGQASRLSLCTDNLAGVAKAVLSHAQDHAQTLPGPVPDQGGEFWWWYKEQVKSHAGLSGPPSPGERLFACPDDRGYSDPKPFHQTARFAFGSYVFNGVTLPGMPNIAGWGLDAVQQPDRTLMVMEWTAHAPLSWHRSRTRRRNLPFYDGAESVVAFVDGHVRLLPIHYDGFTAAFTRDPPSRYGYRYSGRDPGPPDLP